MRRGAETIFLKNDLSGKKVRLAKSTLLKKDFIEEFRKARKILKKVKTTKAIKRLFLNFDAVELINQWI